MATRERRVDAGRARARELRGIAAAQLRTARLSAGLSQAALAKSLGWAQSRVSDLERASFFPDLKDLCELSSLLGLRPSLSFHPSGPPLRDAGHIKLIGRFTAVLSPAWHVALEAPFPTLGDLRSWDVLIRLGSEHRVGVEAETRIRDQQELVRRIRQRELHGGVDRILILLSDSAHNRANVEAFRLALGARFGAEPADLLAALREGRPLPGSGVILL